MGEAAARRGVSVLQDENGLGHGYTTARLIPDSHRRQQHSVAKAMRPLSLLRSVADDDGEGCATLESLNHSLYEGSPLQTESF